MAADRDSPALRRRRSATIPGMTFPLGSLRADGATLVFKVGELSFEGLTLLEGIGQAP